jgi:glutaredoxin
VLCRRAAGSVALDIAADEPSQSGGWIIAGVVVVTALGVAAWSLRARAPKPQPSAAAPLVAPLPLEVVAKPTAAPQPAEDELAKSLRMLERAEQERRAREQVELARQQEQRAAAALQRERDEKVRDERRHAMVQHELDALGLSSARRNVSIIMYSTSWCGVCSRARAYMQQQNIPFTDLDVEHDAAAHERQRALNPRGGVPTISIDDDVLVGFSPESLEYRINRAARRRLGS